VLGGALFAVLKFKLPTIFKAAIIGSAVVTSVLLYSFDAKFWGVVVMGGAVIILFFLPWLDYSPVKSIRYRPDWHKYVYGAFVFVFLILGYLGIQAPGVWGAIWGQDIAQRVSQIGTLFYFGFFIAMPWWSALGTPKAVPERVTFVAH
jgi:ubiquinol-cytochrome c reductase cytochrome b subunit